MGRGVNGNRRVLMVSGRLSPHLPKAPPFRSGVVRRVFKKYWMADSMKGITGLCTNRRRIIRRLKCLELSRDILPVKMEGRGQHCAHKRKRRGTLTLISSLYASWIFFLCNF